MTKLRAFLAFVLGALALGPVACKRAPSQGLVPRGANDAFAGVDCSAMAPPVEPDLTAWEATSRAQLDKLRRQGVVAVRYEVHGCDVSLELIPECVGPKNRYVYSPYNGPGNGTETKIARDSRELLRQLPLGAANVSGLLGARRALRMDARLVGTVALPAGSTITEYDLVGPECKRATHVIQAVHVGGFALAATDIGSVNAQNLFTAAMPLEGMTREGSAPICDRARSEAIELPGCSVPLRVALLKLGAPEPTKAPPREASPCAEDADGGCTREGAEPRVFDQRTVERMVREKQAAVKRKCWEVAPDTLRRVNISVAATIDTRGRVVDPQAQVVDSEGSADVAAAVSRCIASEIQTWQFPEPERPVGITLPFHLIRQQ